MTKLTVTDFEFDECFWKTTQLLRSWSGFQSRRGAYASLDALEPASGVVDVAFAPEGRDDSELSEDEVALVRWVLENENQMQHSLLAALYKEYPSLRTRYSGFLDNPSESMPVVATVDDFRTLIGLHGVNVHPIQHQGLPYAGFEFGCTWDDEHGLGVLMHGTRVVKIGGADTAILLWLAKQDRNRKG